MNFLNHLKLDRYFMLAVTVHKFIHIYQPREGRWKKSQSLLNVVFEYLISYFCNLKQPTFPISKKLTIHENKFLNAQTKWKTLTLFNVAPKNCCFLLFVSCCLLQWQTLTCTTVLQIRHLAKLQDRRKILCNFLHTGRNRVRDNCINYQEELCTRFLILQCYQFLEGSTPLNQLQIYHLQHHLNFLFDHLMTQNSDLIHLNLEKIVLCLYWFRHSMYTE